jgi:hypothetical protein
MKIARSSSNHAEIGVVKNQQFISSVSNFSFPPKFCESFAISHGFQKTSAMVSYAVPISPFSWKLCPGFCSFQLRGEKKQENRTNSRKMERIQNDFQNLKHIWKNETARTSKIQF